MDRDWSDEEDWLGRVICRLVIGYWKDVGTEIIRRRLVITGQKEASL